MQRRKFSREFRLEAVKLIKERRVAVAQAARDIDVAENVRASQAVPRSVVGARRWTSSTLRGSTTRRAASKPRSDLGPSPRPGRQRSRAMMGQDPSYRCGTCRQALVG